MTFNSHGLSVLFRNAYQGSPLTTIISKQLPPIDKGPHSANSFRDPGQKVASFGESDMNAEPTGEGQTANKPLVATSDSWSQWIIAPPAGPEDPCPHIFTVGCSVVTAPNGDIYLISPAKADCGCKSTKCLLYLFSAADNSFIPLETSGETVPPHFYVYGSGMLQSEGGGRIAFIGGSGTDVDALYVYVLDLETKQCSQVVLRGPAPQRRCFYAAVMVGAKFFIFGGEHSSHVGIDDYFDDLWAIDFDRPLNEVSWELIQEHASMSGGPCGRSATSCTVNGTDVVLFGGGSGATFPYTAHNDTWSLDTRTARWTNLRCSGSIPPGRFHHATVRTGDVIYLFGGENTDCLPFADFWALDVPELRWHRLDTVGSPAPRQQHNMFCKNGKIYVLGARAHDIPKNAYRVFDTNTVENTILRRQSQPKQKKDDSPPQYREDELAPQAGPDSSVLSSLLVVLRSKKQDASIDSVANTTSVNLVRKLLTTNNHVSLSLRLRSLADVEILTEFIIYLLDNGTLPNAVVPDANRKARRLMHNLMIKWPFVHKSLLLSRITCFNDQKAQFEGLGDVVKGDFQGKPVVLKLLPTTPNKYFYRELLTWRSVHHKNVLSILGIYEETRRRRTVQYLVVPTMENGTLSRWRMERNPNIDEIRKLTLQVAEGLQYLHSEGIVHGDIHGSNVCLDSHLNAKIASFGILSTSSVQVRSPNFAAPELFCDWDDDELSDSDLDVQIVARTEKSDVYAFGCLYYEVHFNTVPFGGTPYDQLVTLVTKDHHKPDRLGTPRLSDEGWDLMQRCWRTEPRWRPTMENILDEMTDWGYDG